MSILQNKIIILGLLLLIFIAPSITAYWYYQHQTHLAATNLLNYGHLLNPPINFTAMQKNKIVTNRSSWKLLLWYPKVCKNLCQQQLNKLFRIRLALGRKFYDVDQLLVTKNIPSTLEHDIMLPLKNRAIEFVTLNEMQQNKLKMLLNNPQVFIMNPDNYLILSYKLDANPADIFHDLQRLL